MGHFKDSVAIVTGGASGIGRALCEELGRRGAAVIIAADINAEGAQQVASAISTTGCRGRAVHLDVSQPEVVQTLIDETAAENGRLDYMFNNAGIAMGGEVRDMGLEHWRRILDVNLWGVIYGTTSAYRVMVKQGFGHIVNTASAAGLTPAPMVTAYATNKHAVVGLSNSLRAEGAGLGVKVSVVCPGFIRTGIFDAVTNVTKLKDEKTTLDFSSIKMMDANDCACVILRGVMRNKGIITVTAFARFIWWLYRLHPALTAFSVRRKVKEFRALRSER
jgi:NAD(P)-dependent dehydrogenase (short-subunit alcohol dehydrogenase family)